MSVVPGQPRGDRERCPFCFPASVSPRQLLATSEHFYLLAPAGQIVEGFLCVLTHSCRDGPDRLRCLDDMPTSWVDELHVMEEMIRQFYASAYGAPVLFYEHGRGGGGASSPASGDFVFHPHLCALPGPLEVHSVLRRRLAWRRSPNWGSVRRELGPQPYLYVHSEYGGPDTDAVVYFGRDELEREHLESLSLKRLLVEANALAAAADWRKYPGNTELEAVSKRFESWYVRTFRRTSDVWLERSASEPTGR